MKKILFLFFLLSVSGAILTAQDAKFSIGVELVPTLSTLSGNELVDSYDGRFSFAAGVAVEYQVSPHFSLRSGLAFERKGDRTALVYTDVNGEPLDERGVRLHYDYLVLPILGAYRTNGRIPFYIGAGPYLGFLLKQQTVSEAYDRFPEEVEDLTDTSKSIDAGLSWALGVQIPLGDRLLLDVGPRANIGLVNTSEAPVIDDGAVRVNSWGLAVGVRYR